MMPIREGAPMGWSRLRRRPKPRTHRCIEAHAHRRGGRGGGYHRRAYPCIPRSASTRTRRTNRIDGMPAARVVAGPEDGRGASHLALLDAGGALGLGAGGGEAGAADEEEGGECEEEEGEDGW